MQCTKAVWYDGLHILSDHWGIYLDVATAQCLGSNILPLQPIQLWDLSTKRCHQIAPYFDHKHKHLKDHNWLRKIKELGKSIANNIPNHEMAEELYERLIVASIYSGSMLKKFPPAPYSPTIARMRNIHRLLKLAVTQFKTARDMSESIAWTKARLGDAGYELPTMAELCAKALISCSRQLKAALQEEIATQHLHRQHQTTLIQTHQANRNTKLAKKIRGIQRAEEVSKYSNVAKPPGSLAQKGD